MLKEIISKNKSKTNLPSKLVLKHDNKFSLEINNDQLISEYFNNFFSSTGERISLSLPPNEVSPLSFMKNIHVTESFFLSPITIQEVIDITMSMKSKSSSGYDNLSSKLIKELIEHLAEPLTYIFNNSFLSGIFPNFYKIAKILPIFKSGDKFDPNNYRPISLLPVFSKIFEKLIYNRMLDFILKYNLINPNQYGFLKGRSTEQAMLDIVSLKIIEAIENKIFSLGFFLDLSKAFDTISHDILLKKRSYYGISGLPHRLIQSYLENRSQFVVYNNVSSSYQNVSCGVPQVSVLGPLLFLIYINDMPLISSIISYTLFADDTTGIYSSSSLDDLFQSTQTELDKLNTWFRSNKLFINVNKTNFMLFSSKQKDKYITLDNNIHNLKISSSIINCRDEVKFLGLLLDKNLSFKSHLKFLCKKVLKGIYAISRAAKILPSVSLTTLYSALILPYLNYGLLIWGGTSYLSEFNYVILDRGYMGNNMKHLTNLHKLQKRAIRLISKAKRRSHHIPLCHNLNILDLKDLYIIKALSFFHDFYHQKLPPDFHNIFTLYLSRNEQLMIKPKYRRTFYNEFYKVFWNDISEYLLNYFNYIFSKWTALITSTTRNHQIDSQERCRTLLCQKLAPNHTVRQ